MNTHAENGTRNQPIHRRDGITDAERYLKRLCDSSFLSLWSYSGVCRDQTFAKNAPEGREVCDLLVVFENHILIFSDKDCVYPIEGNQEVNWRRWFKRAIQKSADQIWGAERWIKEFPHRLFLDLACTQPFPIDLPDPATATFHRILVAHGISEACMKAVGGSGSLMIAPHIIGTKHTESGCHPFTIGQVSPQKGYVHVFDDTSLAIVMETLDTITDFVMYLTKKENLIQHEQLVWAASEEDLLAHYLSDINSDGEHDFIMPDNSTSLVIQEGLWFSFLQNPRRQAQQEANEVSYLWDFLIERFNKHILAGTQYFTTSSAVRQSEQGMRWLAREPRTRRRMVASALLNMLETRPFSMRRTRIILPSQPGDPYYVFLLLPWFDHRPDSENREVRYKMLEACCRVTKLVYPEAQDIVGLATEAGSVLNESRSEDTLYFNAHSWTEDDQTDAKQLQQDLGLLTKTTSFQSVEQEYPHVPVQPIPPMKGRERNTPCPCGSGKKYKKCCGRSG